VDVQRSRQLLAGVLFGLAGGGAAAFLAIRGAAFVIGLPAEAIFAEPWLAILGYAVWVGIGVILSAAWLRRMRP
jgi:membrane protein implicated in regulation of membrane protease activity